MQRTMLKSKIHRATVTDCDLPHLGSITLISYAAYSPEELETHRPRVVHVDAHNQILAVGEHLDVLFS